MKVKELIEILREYPQDALVAIDYDIDVREDDIKLLDEYFDGDAANPDCLILENCVVNIGW